MRASRPSGARPIHVTIVSDNPRTLAGLERYLEEAGVETAHARDLARCGDLLPERSSAVVLFPDDFGTDAVQDAVVSLMALDPPVFLVLVTRTPQRFAALADRTEPGVPTPVVLPKPAWGWTILDALRSGTGPEREEGDDGD